MPFCSKCGNRLNEGAKFCAACGAKVGGSPAPGPASQPYTGQTYAPAAQPATVLNPRIRVRYRCPSGHVFDGTAEQTNCPTCGAGLVKGGYIQLYRMGNFMGAAVGMGIYIDDLPFGHIGNKQSVYVSLPLGLHKIHMTHTATRYCNDPVYELSPQYPVLCCKAYFTNGGFKINVETAPPESMPQS